MVKRKTQPTEEEKAEISKIFAGSYAKTRNDGNAIKLKDGSTVECALDSGEFTYFSPSNNLEGDRFLVSCIRRHFSGHDIVVQSFFEIVKDKNCSMKGRHSKRFICIKCRHHKFYPFRPSDLAKHVGEKSLPYSFMPVYEEINLLTGLDAANNQEKKLDEDPINKSGKNNSNETNQTNEYTEDELIPKRKIEESDLAYGSEFDVREAKKRAIEIDNEPSNAKEKDQHQLSETAPIEEKNNQSVSGQQLSVEEEHVSLPDISQNNLYTKEPEDLEKDLPELPNITEAEAKDFIYDGRRVVESYAYTFHTFAKRRWVGETIEEVMKREFHAHEPSYYGKAIEAGRIRINGEKVEKERRIRDGDKVSHTIRRSELSVPAALPTVLHYDQTNNLLFVNKTAGMPMHACGIYNKNTTIYLVKKYCLPQINLHSNFKDLFVLHRLDQPVSGLCAFAGNSITAKIFEKSLRSKRIFKMYLARVKGRLENFQVVNQSIQITSYGVGAKMNVDNESGKPSLTKFYPLSYNELLDQSLVLCIPITGRKHQIRLHLSSISHPIIDDSLYIGNQPLNGNKNVATDTHNDGKMGIIGMDDNCKIIDSDGKEVVFCAKTSKEDSICLHSLTYGLLNKDPVESDSLPVPSDFEWVYSATVPEWALCFENIIWPQIFLNAMNKNRNL